jgi:hypothetical protein
MKKVRRKLSVTHLMNYKNRSVLNLFFDSHHFCVCHMTHIGIIALIAYHGNARRAIGPEDKTKHRGKEVIKQRTIVDCGANGTLCTASNPGRRAAFSH